MVASGGIARSRVRTRQDFEEGTYEAVWMRAVQPRVHWEDRRAAHAVQDAAPLAVPVPAPQAVAGMEADVLAPRAGHRRPPWQGVYARLHDHTLDRAHRALAWQLLHGALLPRAARVAYDDRLGAVDGVCTHPACMSVPKTITHALLECPLAVSVEGWHHPIETNHSCVATNLAQLLPSCGQRHHH